MPLLSIIVPVYNQVDTIRRILDKIRMVDIDKQIVVVDDGSNDGTGKILRDSNYDNFKIIHHSSKRGRGAAVLTGLSHADGEFALIQDADWECEPAEYLNLMQAIRKDDIDIVLGVRHLAGQRRLWMTMLSSKIANIFLNSLFNSKLKYQFLVFKLMRKDTLLSLDLKAKGLAIDLEIICNALKKKQRILEIPVSCNPVKGRIKCVNGLRQIFYIFKYRFSRIKK